MRRRGLWRFQTNANGADESGSRGRGELGKSHGVMAKRSWPGEAKRPSKQKMSVTVPSVGEGTGISVFMDSRIARVWPARTRWPAWTGIFQTLPGTSAKTGSEPGATVVGFAE